MTPRPIALAPSSFAQVLPIADTAAGLFHARLFEPETRQAREAACGTLSTIMIRAAAGQAGA
ncbi:MAG: hypothetical protein QM586_04480 [Xenophilus sp.]